MKLFLFFILTNLKSIFTTKKNINRNILYIHEIQKYQLPKKTFKKIKKIKKIFTNGRNQKHYYYLEANWSENNI